MQKVFLSFLFILLSEILWCPVGNCKIACPPSLKVIQQQADAVLLCKITGHELSSMKRGEKRIIPPNSYQSRPQIHYTVIKVIKDLNNNYKIHDKLSIPIRVRLRRYRKSEKRWYLFDGKKYYLCLQGTQSFFQRIGFSKNDNQVQKIELNLEQLPDKLPLFLRAKGQPVYSHFIWHLIGSAKEWFNKN